MDSIQDIKRIEHMIQDYTYIRAVKEELEKQLKHLTPSVTSTIEAAPASTNAFNSKTENTGIKRVEIKAKIHRKKQELRQITDMITKSGLTKEEQGVLWCLAKNERLQCYAREHKISASNVYKIKDRALRKIANHIT